MFYSAKQGMTPQNLTRSDDTQTSYDRKIEKVPRDISIKKVKKRHAWEKLVSTTGEYASPKKGRNQLSGMVSVPCWHTTRVVNAPWKLLAIR